MNEIFYDPALAELRHYGMPRRSGRYPWGSGKDPYQHTPRGFVERVTELRKSGMSDKEIAESMGILDKNGKYSSTIFRARYSQANQEFYAEKVKSATTMREDGKTLREIAEKWNTNESTIRSWLDESKKIRMNRGVETYNTLKELIDKHGIIDVGEGAREVMALDPNNPLAKVSEATLQQARVMLEDEGYHYYQFGLPQMTNPGKQTPMRVLTKSDITHKYCYDHPEKIMPVSDFAKATQAGELETKTLERPVSISSKRVSIKYAEDGGTLADGTMLIRPGVADLDLGASRYAQVRIGVDGTHYLKGMALYGDPKDFPKGTDIIFNTNKSKDTKKMDVLKEMKDDPDNPFGASIKLEGGQSWYVGKDGKKHLSAINKLREEGDWSKQQKTLSSQFLSKQNLPLIKKQLKATYADKESEFNDIKSITNPVLKKYFLRKFADSSDSDAASLKSIALPGQTWSVLMPINSLKTSEVYAPSHKNGEKVALVRYPHGGIFEIPIVTVNNRNPEAKKVLGSVKDAVGINHKVAERLSGADFDGDFVAVIPIGKHVSTQIKNASPLPGLIGFEPKQRYATKELSDGIRANKAGKPVRLMKKTEIQREMGSISNLITDMTILGVGKKGISKDLEKAVRHSMTVIDAHKHKLDYKQSEVDNDIAGLKAKYQKHLGKNGQVLFGGATTIISRASATEWVPERSGNPDWNPKTGAIDWSRKYTNRSYNERKATGEIDKKTGRPIYKDTGRVIKAQQKSIKMLETSDARTLMSAKATAKERAYADYANQMKSLANRARKEYLNTPRTTVSKEARGKYKAEVASLDRKLTMAVANAPRERRAQAIAYSRFKIKQAQDPTMDKEHAGKLKNKELVKARAEVGSSSKSRKIVLTDREWEAIQSRAINDTKLEKIFNHCDVDLLRDRATPKTRLGLTPGQTARAKALYKAGYTQQEIAEQLGRSVSTIQRVLSK